MRPEIIAKLNASHLKAFNERLAARQGNPTVPINDGIETVIGTNYTRPTTSPVGGRGWTLDDVTYGHPSA